MDRNEWATPQWLFDYFNAQYHFTLDPCATPENAKCERYFTKEQDGLKQDWGISGWAFVNPPYGRGLLEPWVEKCFDQASPPTPFACGSVMLLPSRTERPWFHLLIKWAAEVNFIKGRIPFVPPPGVKPSTNRENSIIAVVDPRYTGQLVIGSIDVADLKKGAAGNPRRRTVTFGGQYGA